jgi:hypothetical protein
MTVLASRHPASGQCNVPTMNTLPAATKKPPRPPRMTPAEKALVDEAKSAIARVRAIGHPEARMMLAAFLFNSLVAEWEAPTWRASL